MPRYPVQSSLPPLEKTLPDFKSIEPHRSKLEQVVILLKRVVSENRSTHNLTFYSTREIAQFLKVSQNTAVLAIRRLEGDGLVRRVRGSQTLVLGTKVITRSRIRAVAGLMSWVFAQRFSELQGDLNRHLAEELWPHHIALEIIPHYDLGDTRPDLNESLKKHAVDFTIWPLPFNHHKDHILHLQDRGIRNLVIGVEGIRSPFAPQILIDYRTSYEKVLRYWKEEHDIHRVIVIKPREFAPRRRIDFFAKIAKERGFDCKVESSDYNLPASILAREKDRVGIALLDEHAMVEFCFYDPASFVALLRRHRLLLGIGTINIPFVPHGELKVERIFVPAIANNPSFTNPLAPAISRTLVRWCSGNFNSAPEIVPSRFWENGELWRYL